MPVTVRRAAAAALLSALAVTAVAAPPVRFDHAVREDIFAGFRGDTTARDRGLKTCEDALAKDPKNAEAMVWHGAGTLQRAAEAFGKGDAKAGLPLWMKAIKEMDEAVKLAPDNYGVRIPRGAVYLNAARQVPDDGQRKALLGKAKEDLEYMLGRHKDDLGTISSHRRGELLLGLAEIARRAGEEEKAVAHLKRAIDLDSKSKYATRAAEWLKDPKQKTHTCIGCHTDN